MQFLVPYRPPYLTIRKKLKKIKLPDELKRIEPYTFLDCVALEEVEIGKNIELIDRGAFDNCTSLKTIT